MLNRRGLLRAIPAAPIAARQAAASVSASIGSVVAPSMGYNTAAPLGLHATSVDPYEVMQDKIANWVITGNIPEWKAKQFREQARYRSRWLDADIIAMRSISDTAKYRLQEEREYKRVIQEYVDNHEGASIWSSWMKKLSGGSS